MKLSLPMVIACAVLASACGNNDSASSEVPAVVLESGSDSDTESAETPVVSETTAPDDPSVDIEFTPPGDTPVEPESSPSVDETVKPDTTSTDDSPVESDTTAAVDTPDATPVAESLPETVEESMPGDPTPAPMPDPEGAPSPGADADRVTDAPSSAPIFSDDASGGESVSSSPVVATSPSVVIPILPPLPEPQRPVQSGTLTAGDYDDQLNPWLYQQYSDNYLQNVRPQIDIPRLDLSRRVAVVVKDSSDKPYAGASVALLDSQGNTTSEFKTAANGMTYLYEDLDGFGGELILKVEDRLGDVSKTQAITLESLGDSRRVEVKLDTAAVASSQLDLQLVIDTTGSMGDELNYLQAELSSILNNVQDANPQVSIRTGLVVYRDIGDQYVVRSYPFTDNMADMQSALNGESYDGGGDYPEAMDQAMAEALTFQWRDQSTKISLLVADAPPHSDRVNATWASALAARDRQIHIVPLAASGVAEDAEYLMRSMAALTNSRFLFLTDDSGVGNPHNEPQVDCYIVTRLDGLIKRVVNELLTGNRTEPSDNEVIRQVGDYDRGVCRSEQPQPQQR